MQSKPTTPPVSPASAEDVRAVNDALGDLYHLLQDGAAGDESPRALERYHRAVVAVTSLAALSAKKNGAPRGEHTQTPEAAPSAGAFERVGGLGGERGIRTPERVAPSPDFESGASPSGDKGTAEASDDGGDDDESATARLERHEAKRVSLADDDTALLVEVRS